MSSHFKYLGSIIQKDVEINSDVNHRIQAVIEMEESNMSFMWS